MKFWKTLPKVFIVAGLFATKWNQVNAFEYVKIVTDLNVEVFLNGGFHITDLYDLLFKHVPKDSDIPYIEYSDWEGFLTIIAMYFSDLV